MTSATADAAVLRTEVSGLVIEGIADCGVLEEWHAGGVCADRARRDLRGQVLDAGVRLQPFDLVAKGGELPLDRGSTSRTTHCV